MARTLDIADLKRNPWVVGHWQDLMLVIGLPLLILALAYGLRSVDAAFAFSLLVGIFATGHLCPTLLRVYTDKTLIKSYPLRFLVLPPLLLTAYLVAHYFEIYSLRYLVVLWGHWHGLMQTYGVARIYQAKSGADLDPLQAKLDWSLCFVWFSGGTLMSGARMHELFEGLYRCGFDALPSTLLPTVQIIWTVIATVITTFYIANALLKRRTTSPQKLGLLAISFSFWWLCMVYTPDAMLGIGMWEIFHDVQYATVAWAFGERYKAQHPTSAMGRYLWQRSWPSLMLYVGIIVLFGSLTPLSAKTPIAQVAILLGYVITACNVLHFYYDGFIWKLRDRETRQALRLETLPSSSSSSLFKGNRSWRHGLLWGGISAAALAAAIYQLSQPPATYAVVAHKLTQSLPLR